MGKVSLLTISYIEGGITRTATVPVTVNSAALEPVYALLYSDGELVFQRGNAPETGRTVTAVYSDVESLTPSDEDDVPWYSKHKSIKTVNFQSDVSPRSTAYWFYECENLTAVYKPETREVEDDNPDTPDVVETRTELWYVYTIVYQGEAYFADTIFHLTDEQKELANDYAYNLNLFLLSDYYPASGAPMVVPEGYGAAAAWIQSHYSNGLDAAAKQVLFGDANKSYFATAKEAAPYMRSLKIKVWKLDSNGAKYATTAWITVHSLVADDVQVIFDEIFNDPEHFPIKEVGGGRFTGETGRHAWGCAIDINPYENAECNFRSGSLALTCGYGWWPEGLSGSTEWVGRTSSSYHGSLSGASPYSIKPGGSVVRAFAAHGWGWGGNGWYNGVGFDFMHFSVLKSGG